MKFKKLINFCVAAATVMAIALTVQSYTASEASVTTTEASPKKFVKTKNRCTKCSCTGYWGYKHNNGTYEGSCTNRDKHGHTCGHGPDKHGLKKW